MTVKDMDVPDRTTNHYPLKTIYFYLTDECNLRCRHCWISPEYNPDGKAGRFLPIESLRSIIRQAKPLGLTSVKLTGGEPLLHPDMMGILDIIREEGLKLTLETNGVFLSRELARKIAGEVTPFVAVSLDGATVGTHEWSRGVDGCFDDAIRGIKNAVAENIRTQIIMTLMRNNVGEMEEMVRLAEDLGASSLKFNVLQPTERGLQMFERGETLGVEELLKAGSRVENELSRKTAMKLIFGHPMAFKRMSFLFDDNGGCGTCGIRGIIGVLADGSYALCGIGEHVRELVFGHSSTDRLEEVWKAAPLIRQIREGLPKKLEGACGDCMMKSWCMGKCIAQNYYSTKSLWAPYWYCEEAKKLGQFPQSRSISSSQK